MLTTVAVVRRRAGWHCGNGPRGPVVGILSVVYRHAVEWRGGHATHLAADLLATSQAADV